MNNNTITQDMRPVAIRYMDSPKETNAEINPAYGKSSGKWGDYRYGEQHYIIHRNTHKDFNYEYNAKCAWYKDAPEELRDDEILF